MSPLIQGAIGLGLYLIVLVGFVAVNTLRKQSQERERADLEAQLEIVW